VFLGSLSIYLQVHFLEAYEHLIEQFAGLGLMLFGLIYGVSAYFKHSSCHGHTHHGPDPKNEKAPYLFLLSLGFTPCVAAIPIFITAASRGSFSALFSFLAFACGVLAALMSATYFFSKGLLKLDHPVFEHYGDVITGGGVLVMGMILFLF
jgi:cytochrome c biogenesis protein CcdA